MKLILLKKNGKFPKLSQIFLGFKKYKNLYPKEHKKIAKYKERVNFKNI